MCGFDGRVATPTPSPTRGHAFLGHGTTQLTVLFVRPAYPSGIATRFNLTVDDLVEANRIVNPDALQVGQEITIP